MLALDAGDPANGRDRLHGRPRRQQGNGYAIEAARALLGYAFGRHEVALVRAVTDTRNAPSIAVAERLGMRLVGTVHTTFKGEPCDEHTYEITRAVWEGPGSAPERRGATSACARRPACSRPDAPRSAA